MAKNKSRPETKASKVMLSKMRDRGISMGGLQKAPQPSGSTKGPKKPMKMKVKDRFPPRHNPNQSGKAMSGDPTK
jgi:hypothetical protein